MKASSLGLRRRSVAVVIIGVEESSGLTGHRENLIRVPAALLSAYRDPEFLFVHLNPH
jgi:hypothetical protein